MPGNLSICADVRGLGDEMAAYECEIAAAAYQRGRASDPLSSLTPEERAYLIERCEEMAMECSADGAVDAHRKLTAALKGTGDAKSR